MKDLKHDLGLRIVKALAVVLATIPFALCWYLYYAERIYVPFYSKGNLLVSVLFVMVFPVADFRILFCLLFYM